jgi:hypothetical protein
MFENDFENLGIGSYSIHGFHNEILKIRRGWTSRSWRQVRFHKKNIGVSL